MVARKVGRFLGIQAQCKMLGIKKSSLYKYAAKHEDFPAAFAHPMAPQRMVRAENELQDWMSEYISQLRK